MAFDVILFLFMLKKIITSAFFIVPIQLVM